MIVKVDLTDFEDTLEKIETLKNYVSNQYDIVTKSFDKIKKKELLKSFEIIHSELHNIHEEMELWQ